MDIEPARTDGAAVGILSISAYIHAAVFIRVLEIGVFRKRICLLEAADRPLLIGIDDAHIGRAVRSRSVADGLDCGYARSDKTFEHSPDVRTVIRQGYIGIYRLFRSAAAERLFDAYRLRYNIDLHRIPLLNRKCQCIYIPSMSRV